MRDTTDPRLKAALPTLVLLGLSVPLFCLALTAFGVFMIVLGFRIHREAVGLIIGLAFGLLGIGTLTFLVALAFVAHRVQGNGGPEVHTGLGQDLKLRAPALAPVPAMNVPLPFRLGSWRGRMIVTADGMIRKTRLFMPTPTIPASTVRQVALRRIMMFSGWREYVPRLLLLDERGRCILWINALGVSYDDARCLAAALRVPIDINWEQERTSGWLAREIPGSTTAVEAHPIRTFALVILAIVLAVGIALLIGSR
jgi:hypothetical protein